MSRRLSQRSLWLKIVTVALIGSWSLIGYAIKLLIDHPHILAFAHDVARNGLRYDVKSRVRDYIERENPRGLQEKWIENYVERDRSLIPP